MQLRFVIKKNIKTVIWVEIFLFCTFGFLRDIIGLPGAIAYLLDILNCGIFAWTILAHSSRVKKRWICGKFLGVTIAIFGIYVLLNYFVVGPFSPLLFFWGLRNTFRFYIFFLNCVWNFDSTDVDGIVLFLKKLFYLNVILATLEFLMGYSGDNIGGSFGTASGCNGSLNFLLVIISCVYITEYLEKNVELSKMSIALLCCLYLTAISELKVFFFELPVIIVIAMINAKFSFRKIVLTVLGTIGIILGVSLMGRFFDGSGFDFFSSNKIAEYMGDRGYTGAGDLSRFNAIPKVTKLFFSADRTKLFFGFGLGNCSYSSFEALTSDFFRRYEWLHYHWFADSMIYLETGLIGLIIFESFFVSSFFSCRKLSGSCTRDREEKASIPKMVSIFSVCCLISSVYNIALLVESGYLAYLVLTLPLIIEKKSPNIGNVGMENRHGERI